MNSVMKMRDERTQAARVVFALLTASLILAGCASAPANRDQPAIDRAQARWDAIIAGDLESAYTYYSPGYRSANSLIDFGVTERMKKVAYTSAEYLESDCEESRCRIKFTIGYRVVNPVPGLSVYESKTAIEDTWIRTSGQWWYLPKK